MGKDSLTDKGAGSVSGGSFRRSDAITGTAARWSAKTLGDRYVLGECLEVTEGGVAVFEATDEVSGAPVEASVALDAGGERALARVTDAMWLLKHRTLARTLARADGYIIFERTRGPRLQRLAERGGANVTTAMLSIAAVVDAVAMLHEVGLVHGAVHPGAVRVGLDGASLGWFVSLGRTGRSYLRPGGFCAIAPEVAMGGAVEEHTDVFAIGATLYWTLTGHDPSASLEPSRSRRPNLRPLDDFIPDALELSRLVHDCLDPNPHRRPPNALALQERLAAVRSKHHVISPAHESASNSSEFIAATHTPGRIATTSLGGPRSTWDEDSDPLVLALSLDELAWAEES